MIVSFLTTTPIRGRVDQDDNLVSDNLLGQVPNCRRMYAMVFIDVESVG